MEFQGYRDATEKVKRAAIMLAEIDAIRDVTTSVEANQKHKVSSKSLTDSEEPSEINYFQCGEALHWIINKSSYNLMILMKKTEKNNVSIASSVGTSLGSLLPAPTVTGAFTATCGSGVSTTPLQSDPLYKGKSMEVNNYVGNGYSFDVKVSFNEGSITLYRDKRLRKGFNVCISDEVIKKWANAYKIQID